jgi:hypothetical protein
MKAAELRTEFRQALIACDLPRITTEELLRGLDVVIEAVRAEAARSSLAEWVQSKEGHSAMIANRGTVHCRLDRTSTLEDHSFGEGATVEAAFADAIRRDVVINAVLDEAKETSPVTAHLAKAPGVYYVIAEFNGGQAVVRLHSDEYEESWCGVAGRGATVEQAIAAAMANLLKEQN